MSIEESPSPQQEQMPPPPGQMQEPQAQMAQGPQGHMMPGGHLYMQTNEIRNCVIHYQRAMDGTITEAAASLPVVPVPGPTSR